MTLVLANLVPAAYLTGLIWFVGVVHYPLFARVGRAEWPAYERAHRTRTTVVVAPAMLAQVPVGIGLIAFPPDGVESALAIANLACVAVALASTGLVFGPAHVRLERRWTDRDHRLLVRGNWLRVAAWTVQTAVAVALVGQAG